jgi:hypothetical protein
MTMGTEREAQDWESQAVEALYWLQMTALHDGEATGSGNKAAQKRIEGAVRDVLVAFLGTKATKADIDRMTKAATRP